nr:hypothetical protein [uncultured Methanospirillum sp.]
MKKDEIHIISIDLVESFINGMPGGVGNEDDSGMGASSPPGQINSAYEYPFLCGCEW